MSKEELAQSYKLIGDFITDEGDLHGSSGNWISWMKGDSQISLDGDFTVEQLKEILSFVTGGCVSSECPFFEV